ncbi:Asp-tRNA(Asn)/Glu-tRNA(Gln) amidotransferase GatCAB subunit B [bacterium (Candidatus Howlettbacteria) CG_4_10_14_0_8_um_filter_40_9]|nr:MAG: Asp-tRNA(Asn)/Glu-tRNA(Gln) amidotransferase GatCAB subunit B [bacterium (Candidatus Howlettbacteria) CG_4_10_14_0_8_um_filter_40_9]
MKDNYEVVIGLEIHAQLKTESKMFCRCSNAIVLAQKNAEKDTEKRGIKLEEPNSRVCPVCLGMPGSLPVANRQAIESTILLGLALGSRVPEKFNFERKNYFYPDLPKAYQISSATNPPVVGGFLEIETLRLDSTDSTGSRQGSSPQAAQDKQGIRKIQIHHIHLEEDAGKLVHEEGKDYSLVDLNRAGTPLMEIVTEPDLRSPEEAKVFLQSLRGILRYLKISDADMEKGQMRCDANISLRKKGAKELGTKVEIKNINSFKMVERALEYEIERQTELLESNTKVVQETRGWNDAKGKSISQRTKEESMDYRYFPDPDIPTIKIGMHGLDTDLKLTTDEHGFINIDEIRKLIPELPKEKRERFVSEYGLGEKDAFTLTADHALANYFERTLEEISDIVKGSDIERNFAKKISNWILNELLARLNSKGESIEETKVLPEHLAELVTLIEKGTVSGKMAKEIFEEMFEAGKTPASIIKEKGLEQVSGEEELGKIVDEVLEKNSKSVKDFKSGKMNALGYLVGQVMAVTKGKANPGVVNEILRKKLET